MFSQPLCIPNKLGTHISCRCISLLSNQVCAQPNPHAGHTKSAISNAACHLTHSRKQLISLSLLSSTGRCTYLATSHLHREQLPTTGWQSKPGANNSITASCSVKLAGGGRRRCIPALISCSCFVTCDPSTTVPNCRSCFSSRTSRPCTDPFSVSTCCLTPATSAQSSAVNSGMRFFGLNVTLTVPRCREASCIVGDST